MKKFILKMVVVLNKKGYKHLIKKIGSKGVSNLTMGDIRKIFEYKEKLKELDILESQIELYY